MSFLRDVGQPHRFHRYWPHATDQWPGRELYFAWRHPILILLLFVVVVNMILGFLGYAVVAP